MSFRSLAYLRGKQPNKIQPLFRIGVDGRAVTFRPSNSMVDRLGWKVGDRINIAIGEGKDAGIVQLCRLDGEGGWKLVTSGGGSTSLAVKISRHIMATPNMPATLPMSDVRAEVRGKAAVVWLPWEKSGSIEAKGQEGTKCSPRSRVAAPGPSDRRPADVPEDVTTDQAGAAVESAPPVTDDYLTYAEWVDRHNTVPEPTVVVVGSSEGGETTLAPIPEPAATVDATEQPPEPNGIGCDGGEAVAEVNAGSCGGDVCHRSLGPVAEADEATGKPGPVAGDEGGSPSPPFPIQTKSLDQVDKPIYGRVTNDPTTWLSDVRDRFISAAARQTSTAGLVQICGRSTKAVESALDLLHDEIVARRVRLGRQESSPIKKGPLPNAPKHDSITRVISETDRKVPRREVDESAPAAKPSVSAEVLKFLREEVFPILKPLGREIKKNHDDTGLLLDGKPATVEEIVAETNRLLEQAGEEPIKFEIAA